MKNRPSIDRQPDSEDRWLHPCDLCGSQENLQRQQVKAMLGKLHAANDKVKGNMLTALRNVRVSHLLDRDLLARSGSSAVAEPGEDPLSAL